jgi:sialic acid synthase SpsE
VKDMRSGEKLTRENLRAIRPGLGLPTKYFDQLLGKRVVCDVRRGTAAAWDLLGL